MKKEEILSKYRIDKVGNTTVFMQNKFFNFSYTIADSVVKDEYLGKYRYFGGLQCEYDESTEEYKNLEKWLCEIAEYILHVKH